MPDRIKITIAMFGAFRAYGFNGKLTLDPASWRCFAKCGPL